MTAPSQYIDGERERERKRASFAPLPSIQLEALDQVKRRLTQRTPRLDSSSSGGGTFSNGSFAVPPNLVKETTDNVRARATDNGGEGNEPATTAEGEGEGEKEGRRKVFRSQRRSGQSVGRSVRPSLQDWTGSAAVIAIYQKAGEGRNNEEKGGRGRARAILT